jgi:hypothetical protein
MDPAVESCLLFLCGDVMAGRGIAVRILITPQIIVTDVQVPHQFVRRDVF